jgi:hypothetical protein
MNTMRGTRKMKSLILALATTTLVQAQQLNMPNHQVAEQRHGRASGTITYSDGRAYLRDKDGGTSPRWCAALMAARPPLIQAGTSSSQSNYQIS